MYNKSSMYIFYAERGTSKVGFKTTLWVDSLFLTGSNNYEITLKKYQIHYNILIKLKIIVILNTIVW